MKLIEEVKTRGYQKIVLHATAKGRTVYEKLGFIGTFDEMVLKLP